MPQYSNYDVETAFKNFGLSATPEEIAQFSGVDYVGGGTAIANYVQTKKSMLEREANDPLKKVLEAQQTFTAAQQARAEGLTKESDALFTQLMGKLSEAPKLFGNLTPEQINTYMAPIKAQVEGDIARRGLAGSSTEINALTQNATKAGLDVGRELQTQQASALQNEIASKRGLLSGAVNATAQGLNMQGNTAGEISQGARDDERFLSSLPLYLRSYAAQELANWKAGQKQKKGILGTMSDISQGIDLAGNILSLGGLDRVLPKKGGGASVTGYSSSGSPMFTGGGGGAGGMQTSTAAGGSGGLELGPEALALFA